MHENAPSVEHTDGTRARRNGQAPSLTKQGGKLAGLIFDSLTDQGEYRTTFRSLRALLGGSMRGVQDAVQELETAGRIEVARGRTGLVVRWLSSGGVPVQGVPSLREGYTTVPGYARRADDEHQADPDPKAERIREFRQEIGPEGCAKLDQAYADGRAMRLEYAELRRTTSPEQIKENIGLLKRAIAKATEPELMKARAAARAAEPVVVTRGGHPDLTDAEYVAGCDALEQLTSRYGSNSAARRRELLARARCDSVA